MGCAEAGRADLTYVNADGTLTKDGRTVTLSGDSSKNSDARSINPGTVTAGNSTSSSSLDASVSASSSNSSKTNSWESESGSGSNVISPGSSSANQQAEFNPGSILSDGSDKSASDSNGGLGLGSIIGIVVGCLAVVAIAAGMRLLKKGKEAELATPENGGVADGAAVEGYGGGGGMTPKENVLLL
ncbi:hypothetical protein BBO99_00003680 [Phytophthora kernoviae]|uniref:Uncharacterized protein n=2 Tax=Phytophthora kernoviae TaxID=325452 RepID=A0A3R7K0M9_9STRA|nr:hypothetical protein G195_006094 [Phytophthora kernoviae 00238/432]KAG2523492.1 hypothetical protein JM16_002269 [Phytophthora kernoviae]KAG2525412.1 hypothetical protein JM18_002343 [Phytophthora kernoviae]RLN10481.1 hypothetical protein BBI17_003702 [Phytophthora kernoviae]RLN81486.1 hypothetical protein BBO99_00003680 [Phytophthora kernoviae]